MIKTSQKSVQGFTLIEVLIVVVIMGLLVYFAINFISGDTQKANFTVSVNDFKQAIEQFINETYNGYYPNKNDFTCKGYSDAATSPTFTSAATNQGQNYNCIFLGKVILFTEGGGQYSVYAVIGNQYDSGQFPSYIYNNVGSNGANPDINYQYDVFSKTISNGLTIYADPVNHSGVTATDASPAHSTAAIGFLIGSSSGSIASYGAQGLNSGSEQLSLYYDGQSALGSISTGSQLNSDVTHANGLLPAKEVDICVVGGNNQSGKLKIGDSNTASSGVSNLIVNLTIYNDGTCS